MAGKLILVFTVIAVFNQLTESLYVGYGSSNLRRYIQLVQALKYGDGCSWEAEEYRQNFTRNIMSSGAPVLPSMQTAMEMAKTMVERNYKLCSAAELFICDKASLKCVCGDPGYEVVKGVNRSLYVLEGNNKCRWDTNTYCAPDDSMASLRQMGVIVDSKCKLGTSCKLDNGEMCSLLGVVRYILRNHGFGAITNRRRITEEMLSGNVCACRADQVDGNSIENEISFWDNADSPSVSRRKRSVSEIQAGMLAKYATGATIAI